MFTKGISVVMPMFNEEGNIADAVRNSKDIVSGISDDYEIVVVDDASTDNSVDVVKGLMELDDKIKLFCLDKNTKFGGAFAEAFKRASKGVILYMDSDMPVEAEDIKTSLPLIKGHDIVTGYSRIKKGETFLRKLISGVYNFMVQSLFRLSVKDINSGYKIVRREMVKDITFISQSPFIDVELFIHAKKKNGKIKQYPLIFKQRTSGRSHIARVSVIAATFRDMIKVWIMKRGN